MNNVKKICTGVYAGCIHCRKRFVAFVCEQKYLTQNFLKYNFVQQKSFLPITKIIYIPESMQMLLCPFLQEMRKL